MHRPVRGVAPDGRRYAADDPELVTWIHVAEMSSFLHAAQRFGPLRFSHAECDRYYEETAGVALALGAAWVPRSVDEVTAYLARVRPDLYAGPQALVARDFLVRGVGRKPEDRAVHAMFVGAAVEPARALGPGRAGHPQPAPGRAPGDGAPRPRPMRRVALGGGHPRRPPPLRDLSVAPPGGPGATRHRARVSPPSTATI